MRVLYFTGAYRPDSMISHTHGELVAALRDRSVTIEMLSTAPAGQHEPVAQIIDSFGNHVWYVRPHAGPLDRAYRAVSARRWRYTPYLSYIPALRRFFTPARLASYDLLHVGMAYPYGTILRHAIGKRPRPATIVTITGGDILTDDETGYGYTRSPAIRRETQRTLHWATLVQANSPLTASVVRAFGCPEERIAILPPHSPQRAVPPDMLAEYRARARTLLVDKGDLPHGRILLGLGRMERIKGYDDVIRALLEILRQCPDVTAVFAGPARGAAAQAYADGLTSLARDLGVSDHVRVLSRIPHEDVADYMAAAELVMVPSLLDGLNQTGVEGGAVGTPCIASDRAGIASYIAEYGAGRTVPARDPSAIARAVIALLTDTVAWQAASRGAHAMTTSFSLDNIADAAARMYERALGAEECPAPVLYSPPAARRAGGGDK